MARQVPRAGLVEQAQMRPQAGDQLTPEGEIRLGDIDAVLGMRSKPTSR
jgi:hypothetical protein